MSKDQSIAFFDRQFRHQAGDLALKLNPFEELALPYLSGEVLDFGCGLGNLAFAAAKRGCEVVALDASPAAIAHIRSRAKAEAVPVTASLADLRDYEVTGAYDCIVCIGLLMFFDCPTAFRVLSRLQEHVRPGGVAIVNVLVQGTTYLDMFDPESHCLFVPGEIQNRFADWSILHSETSVFDAPRQLAKRFSTVIARKPNAGVRPIAGSRR